MFRKSFVTSVASLGVWLLAAVAIAAPVSTFTVELSTPDASVEFSIEGGQVGVVSGSAQCPNGNVESWTSVDVVSSTVEFGKGQALSRIAARADVVHVDCFGAVTTENVSIRTTYDDSGKAVRERDAATGTRTITVPVAGTITLPNQVLGGAGGFEVETITR